MQPPEQAERIISDVSFRVEVDRGRLRELIAARFVPGAHWHDLMEAERVAGEVVEAQADLHDNGAESWIARAVMHQQAFQLAWDVLEEKGLLTELD